MSSDIVIIPKVVWKSFPKYAPTISGRYLVLGHIPDRILGDNFTWLLYWDNTRNFFSDIEGSKIALYGYKVIYWTEDLLFNVGDTE